MLWFLLWLWWEQSTRDAAVIASSVSLVPLVLVPCPTCPITPCRQNRGKSSDERDKHNDNDNSNDNDKYISEDEETQMLAIETCWWPIGEET